MTFSFARCWLINNIPSPCCCFLRRRTMAPWEVPTLPHQPSHSPNSHLHLKIAFTRVSNPRSRRSPHRCPVDPCRCPPSPAQSEVHQISCPAQGVLQPFPSNLSSWTIATSCRVRMRLELSLRQETENFFLSIWWLTVAAPTPSCPPPPPSCPPAFCVALLLMEWYGIARHCICKSNRLTWSFAVMTSSDTKSEHAPAPFFLSLAL